MVVNAMGMAAEAQAWTSRDVRDWSVSCSNGLTCTMSFYDWDARNLNRFHIRREGAPNAKVEILLPAPADFDSRGDATATFSLVVDGKEAVSTPVTSLARDAFTSQFIYADQAQIGSLLDAMKVGTAMELRYKGALGDFALSIKLSGVKGSLLFMDEAQDRLGRSDALEAKGDKQPPEGVTARDITSIDQLPELAKNDLTGEGGACSDLEPDALAQFNGFEVNVDGTRLIAIPCGVGGAYNQPYALYLDYDVVTERISFPDTREGLPSAMTTAYNLDYDATTRILTSFFKGRGIGDCGQWYKWRLDVRGGGAALVLLEERNKDDCDGIDVGGPQNFPLVFPVAK
jgi:hypothetical protein